jgi:hypothetical protein
MNCPDWQLLAARRDTDPAAEVEWERALVHLQSCGLCYETALRAEPTLLFRQLPAFAAGADEVADMKQAVAALRRSHELERPAAEARRRWRYLRIAAVNTAVLVGAALLAGQFYKESPSLPLASPADPAAVVADMPSVAPAAQALRFEIQVLSTGPSEVVVLAQAGGTGREGEDVRLELGDYQVSFKPRASAIGEPLPLEGFRVTRQLRTTDKSRQLPPRDLFHATVKVWMAKPLNLVLSRDEASQESLVIAITCRPETESPAVDAERDASSG